MVQFTSFVLSAWLAHAVSARTSMRSYGKATSRQLSNELIAGYAPASTVTDHNAIDLDQKHIEIALAKRTDTGFVQAKAIYTGGGHSKSFAVITLTTDLEDVIKEDAVVVGMGMNKEDVRGTVLTNANANQAIVKVQYNTSEMQATYVLCRVGELLTDDAVTEGCLVKDGSIKIDDKEFNYSYDPLEDNNNGRTIQGFSTSVEKKMIKCIPGCPFKDAEMFLNYYGVADYADKWIMAAFDSGKTGFDNFNADFSKFSFIGRAEVIKKGTAYMNVFMYVIREFEDAIVDCKTECDIGTNCNDDAVHAWDEGVAFYTGSLEGVAGTSDGKLLHQLADKRCKNFNTCGTDNVSEVNTELLKLFTQGKEALLGKKCGSAKPILKDITSLMFVPLVQGTIRYAYKVEKAQGGEKEMAEGAVFAAAVLPRVHNVTVEGAKTIADSMMVGATATSFSDVKTAFESAYEGMGITCAQVGGLVDADGEFFEGAEPCNESSNTKSESAGTKVGLMVGTLGTIAVALSIL